MITEASSHGVGRDGCFGRKALARAPSLRLRDTPSLALIAQGGPVVPRCILEGKPCPDASGEPWVLIAIVAVLVLILAVAVIQRIRFKRRERDGDG